ncbi:MAG: type II secretion system inner membrane protein GspF [Nitrospinota bacterium]
MAAFGFKGIDSQGKELHGVIDADSIKQAKQKLRSDGVYPTSVKQEKEREKGGSGFSSRKGRVKSSELPALYRQLSTLVGAGVPLVDALTGLVKQTGNIYLKTSLTGIKNRVNEGGSFADAAREYPKIFPELYVNMIAVGEESGTLEIVLTRMADISEESMKLLLKVRGALVYPLLMLVVGAGVIAFLLAFVIPRVTEVFDDFQAVLPLPTRILLFVSGSIEEYWYFFICALTLLGFFVSRYLKSERGRRKFDTVILKVPVLGNLFKLTAFSRFSRTLSTLLASGVPMLKSMDIVAKVVNNCLIADTIHKARVSIGEGSSIAAPLQENGIFPETVVQMIMVGEKSGDLEGMLLKVADSFDTQLDIIVSTLTSVIEPIIILVLGVGVGFIVISILLPIFEMSQLIR